MKEPNFDAWGKLLYSENQVFVADLKSDYQFKDSNKYKTPDKLILTALLSYRAIAPQLS